MRITDHLGLTLGVGYDLQTFATKYLKTNPLWLDSGKVSLDLTNFAPRAGVSYAFGNGRPTVVRIGYGLFYPRIPQTYNSAIETENGLVPTSIFLNQTNYYDRQIFPQCPYSLVNCARWRLPALLRPASCNARKMTSLPLQTPFARQRSNRRA